MEINIAHLFPDLLNLYGDRGNIQVLKKRLEWRNIRANIISVLDGSQIDFENTDILFLGGGSDREQKIVCDKLLKLKNEIKEYAESGKTIVAVCGGYQLLGNYYKLKEEQIGGLGIVDINTVQGDTRLIGNIIINCEIDGKNFDIAGFENHGGITYINGEKPLGKVVKGYGNNGSDGFEGVIYKNVFGTYLHGPVFPKNPLFADAVLERTLKHKYQDFKGLVPIDDSLENTALENIKEYILK